MTDNNSNKPTCPVGEKHCVWLDEVQKLNARVDELAEMVSHDALTGLFNRRHFNHTLKAALEGTRRSLRPACLIMLDLDHFKRVNDTWGHAVGDQVLQHTARILQKAVRMVDVACRYGGEEFAVILPDTRLGQAVEVAERIRLALVENPLQTDDGEITFTASFGVDTASPTDSLSAEDLIDSTDKLLYRAKENGRNRVCHRDLTDSESSTEVSREERDALRELFGE